MKLRCPYFLVICRGKLVNSAEGAEVGQALMYQQVIAGNLPSAEDAAAATTEQQTRASVPVAPVSSTATPSQAGNGSAALLNTPVASDFWSMYPGQHNDEPQPAGQLPQFAPGHVGASRNSSSRPRKLPARAAQQASVAIPQAASDSAGRFRGFE